jgi:hypothetical protein
MMRNVVALIIVVCIGIGVFVQRRTSASREIRSQMLQIVDDMDLAAQERTDVKSLVAHHHEQAFAAALDMSRRLGRKFDERSYYEEVFGLVTGSLRAEGKAFLADKIDRLKEFHVLSVTER